MSISSQQNLRLWIFASPIQYEYFNFSLSSQVYMNNLQKKIFFVLTVLALLLSYGHLKDNMISLHLKNMLWPMLASLNLFPISYQVCCSLEVLSEGNHTRSFLFKLCAMLSLCAKSYVLSRVFAKENGNDKIKQP